MPQQPKGGPAGLMAVAMSADSDLVQQLLDRGRGRVRPLELDDLGGALMEVQLAHRVHDGAPRDAAPLRPVGEPRRMDEDIVVAAHGRDAFGVKAVATLPQLTDVVPARILLPVARLWTAHRSEQ